ncbi:hypothetical protein INR49_020046 [Caranx melampygus]|nr:hypothetical protein INR49_020046 [Caranx melampygus]
MSRAGKLFLKSLARNQGTHLNAATGCSARSQWNGQRSARGRDRLRREGKNQRSAGDTM